MRIFEKWIWSGVLIFLTGFIPFQGISQQVNDTIWTLEECIQYALNENLTIKRSELSVRDYEIQLNQARADLYPNLNFGGQYSNLWGRSIDPTTNLFSSQRIQSGGVQASSSVTLYGGSQLRNTIKRNKLDLEASTLELEAARNDVMLNVTLAFLNIILNVELLENATYQLQTTQTQLETTRKQVEVGALPLIRELELVAQVESNEVSVINAENEVRLTKLRLKQFLLIPAGVPFEIEIPDLDIDEMAPVLVPAEEVFRTAETIMPEIKSADLTVKSSELGVKIARGGLDPRLFAQGNMYTNYSSARSDRIIDGEPTVKTIPIGYVVVPDPFNVELPVFSDIEIPPTEGYTVATQFKDNWSYSVGLTLQIPVFNGLISRSMFQRAKINSRQAEIYSKEVRQNLRQTIEISYNDALAASKTYNASQKQVASLEEAFRAAERSYNLGAMNIYDYQVASNNLFRAKSDLLRAKYNYIFTVKVLDFYLGKPLSLDN
ncbi:MAG: TolC family protein [Cyclobacteriaceae bacterium]|nr:TolC family protein [Cyclobacteriaceae bacterium]